VRLGVHMPQKGGFEANVKRVAAIGCRSIQIFPGNPTGWRMGKMTKEEISSRADLLEQYGIYPLVVHSAYLINLATNKEEFLLKSKKLLDELSRVSKRGWPNGRRRSSWYWKILPAAERLSARKLKNRQQFYRFFLRRGWVSASIPPTDLRPVMI